MEREREGERKKGGRERCRKVKQEEERETARGGETQRGEEDILRDIAIERQEREVGRESERRRERRRGEEEREEKGELLRDIQ